MLRRVASYAAVLWAALVGPAWALSPPPTVIGFDSVPLGQVAGSLNVAGVMFRAEPVGTCGAEVISDAVAGHRALRVSCASPAAPVLRVTFPKPQSFVGVQATPDSVPYDLTAYYPSGAQYSRTVQFSAAPVPARPGIWSPPAAHFSVVGSSLASMTMSANGAARPFTVRTVGFSQDVQPDIEITAGPPEFASSTSASISFSSSTSGALFSCKLWPGDWAPCTSPYTVEGLGPGRQELAVRLDSDDWLGSAPAESRVWTIDLDPPETFDSSVFMVGEQALYFYTGSDENEVTYECSLDGAPFGPCPAGHVFRGLAPGRHTARVRAIDRAGNVDPTPASATWDVAAPAITTPFASPFLPAGPPTAGRSVRASVRAGQIFVRIAGRFVALPSSANIPVGAAMDARKGTIAITTAADFLHANNPKRKFGSARLSAGMFAIKQRRAARNRAHTDITILTPAGRARACAARKPPNKGVVRTLNGVIKGTYRTLAAAATVTANNARWTIQDTCKGTRVKVASGSATVYDKARRRNVKLKVGRSYLARARLFAARIKP